MNTLIAHEPSREPHGESFLYLYLSLMVAIFSIVTVLSLRTIRANEKHLTHEAASSLDDGEHTVHGAPIAPFTRYPIELFNVGGEGTSINEIGYTTLLFLLNSHDVNAVVEVYRDTKIGTEQNYADALTLQQRLEGEGLSPEDVRVELVFSPKKDSKNVVVTFYPNK